MKSHNLIAGLGLLVLGCAIGWYQGRSTREKPDAIMSISHIPSELPYIKAPLLTREVSRIADTGLHWEERIAAVRELPEDLEQSTIDFLFDYLSKFTDENREIYYLVCNEIMEVFRKRGLAPGYYNRRLCHLISDPNADPVIRDYAVQHLSQLVSGMSSEASESATTEITSAVNTMLQEASRRENGQLTLPGTVFHAMTDAVLNGSEEMKSHRPAIVKQAMTVLADPSFSTVTRSSAIQTAARLDAPGLREHCLGWVENNRIAPDLRLSAIAALGKVGDHTDAILIKTLLENPDYHHAANAALQALNIRSSTY